MLYSETRLLVDSADSLVASDRVFVGNQPDDFALAGLLTPAAKPRICLLGLGFGGAIRPILAAAPTADLVAVDLSVDAVQACRAIFSRHFPGIRFEALAADAARFSELGIGAVDAVCVDLYDESGYPAFVFAQEFWLQLRPALSPGAVVLINAWGLPEHLHWSAGPSAQSRLTRVISSVFPEIAYLPYRRNITIVAAVTKPGIAARGPAPGELTAVDEAILRLLPARARRSAPLPEVGSGSDQAAGTRAEIDAEMRRRWPGLVECLTQSVAGSTRASQRPTVLRELLSRPDLAKSVTRELLAQGRPEADFVPVALAAEVFATGQVPSWYLDWVCEDFDEVHAHDPRWAVNVFLWQALAMLANPFGHGSEFQRAVTHLAAASAAHDGVRV